VALLAPRADTAITNVFLQMLSEALQSPDHVVLIMDQAGWHKAKALQVPDNITIRYLPPYSPELNPVERLWAHLRGHHMANLAYRDYEHLLEASSDAYQALTPEIIRSVCACDYITRGLEG
jgi:transposase